MSEQQIVLGRTAFQKNSCVNLDRNGRGSWLQVGKKDDQWQWEKAKLSDAEVGRLLLVLDRIEDQASFFHKFEGKETKVNIRRKDDAVFVRINEFAAALNLGDQVAFAVLCNKILEKGSEREPWRSEEYKQRDIEGT